MPHSVIPSVSEGARLSSCGARVILSLSQHFPWFDRISPYQIVIAMMPGRATLCGAANVRSLTVKCAAMSEG
jgi:hypothetical protein